MKNQENIYKFYALISTQIKINNMKILYRASKDGFSLNNLKDKINNKSNLIFLFLLEIAEFLVLISKQK